MIDASIEAIPGLLLTFGVLTLILALPVGLLARVRQKPVAVRVMCTVSVAGVCAVTLLPTDGGPVGRGAICDVSSPFPQVFLSSSALLNVALFVPAPFFGVLVFRRFLTVAVVAVLSSGCIELIQAEGAMGRACSTTDIVANATGALIGTAGGVVWLRWRGQEARWRKTDAFWGVGLAVVGAMVLTGVFQTSVEPYLPLSERDDVKAQEHALEGSDAWITAAAKDVFGAKAPVREVVSEKRDARHLVTASTDSGDISGWWPEKKLVQAAYKDNRAEAGSLSMSQAEAVGTRFAERWFPEEIRGAVRKVRMSGTGETAVYMVSYRRYTAGVMMPMRLSIMVTSAGRIMNFSARAVEDPDLPKVVVTEDEAGRLAHQYSGRTTQGAVLLAQRVTGRGWRPVWMVGIETSDVFLDAVTGRRIPRTSLDVERP
ncbi:VanZ family protein [Streptomyces sp. NPDC046928]|uniref:VanZ family protein n=1 Tax=Streptomyces sp. NPDC046928 TaxID=3155021 RepID=UPI0033C41DB4